jgi:tight adherence protein B
VSYLFYHSWLALVLLVPFYPVFLRLKSKRLLQQKKQELCLQFKEAILSVAAALNAGYSVENAWTEARTEMVQMYGEKALIVRELTQIQAHLSMNVPLEELLQDFARRSDLEDVSSFCQVFFFAKRTGGNFVGIIRATAERIGEKIDLQQQLMADLAARRLESQIMNVVPLAILLYLQLTSPGYFDILYGNLAGVCIMSACLLVYLFAYALSERMFQQTLVI